MRANRTRASQTVPIECCEGAPVNLINVGAYKDLTFLQAQGVYQCSKCHSEFLAKVVMGMRAVDLEVMQMGSTRDAERQAEWRRQHKKAELAK